MVKTANVPAHKQLDRVLEDIPAWAADKDLVALCEMPELGSGGPAVWIGAQITAERFVDLAGRAGARLLYYSTEYFDVAGFLDWAAESDIPELETDADALAQRDSAFGKQLQALRDRARPHADDLAMVAMCFVADGVAHYWAARTPWLSELDMDHAQLQELRDLAEDDQREDDKVRSNADPARMTGIPLVVGVRRVHPRRPAHTPGDGTADHAAPARPPAGGTGAGDATDRQERSTH